MHALNDELTDFASAIVYGEAPSSQIVAGYQHYSSDIAIEVYRNNFRGNLHDTLASAYPVVEQLVGKDFFRHMTRAFIGQRHSRSGNLHQYGAEMASFIASFEPAQELPYLADVAKLEWACHCAYFADDAAMLDVAMLVQIPVERYPDLILYVHPACRLVRSRYPIVQIWHAHQPGAPEDFHIDLNSGPCNVLVSRKDDVVQVDDMTDAEAEWLQYIQPEMPLEQATATTLEQHPDFDLQATLAKLVAQNIITNFTLGEIT